MKDRYGIAFIIALIILVGVTSWLTIDDDQSSDLVNKISKSGVAKTIKLYQMQTDGKLNYEAYAVSAEQYDNEQIALHEIVVKMYSKNPNQYWHISAKHGLIYKGRHKIKIWNHVVARRNKFANSPKLQFKTETLFLYPDTHIVSTTDKVVFLEPDIGNVLSGVGMRMNLKNKLLKLNSQVSGIYNTKQEPLHITSKTFMFDDQKAIAVFSGNVKTWQSTKKLFGDKIVLQTSERHKSVNLRDVNNASMKLKLVTVYGTPARYQYLPDNNKGLVKGEAQKIVYDPSQQTYTFLNHAVVSQNGNVFSGSKIVYDSNTHTVITKEPLDTLSHIVLQPYDENKSLHNKARGEPIKQEREER